MAKLQGRIADPRQPLQADESEGTDVRETMGMTTTKVSETGRRCFGLLIAVSLFFPTARGQEITTTYQYSHCNNDPVSCPYTEQQVLIDRWSKTIEPDTSYQIVDFDDDAHEIKQRTYSGGGSLLKTVETTWSGVWNGVSWV